MRISIVILEVRGVSDQVLMLQNEEEDLFLPWIECKPDDDIMLAVFEETERILPGEAARILISGAFHPLTEQRPFAAFTLNHPLWSAFKNTLALVPRGNVVLISSTEALSRNDLSERDREILDLSRP